jgi:hypothetical protein
MNWLGAGMNPQTYGAWGAAGDRARPGRRRARHQMPSPLDPAAMLMKMLPIPGAQPAAK